MNFLCYIYPIVLALLQLTEAAPKKESILLSNVKSLTLRKDLKTSHNRVSAVPQLTCIGGNAKGLYEIDIMRCKNQGSDYEEENIQWTCTASLPPEFKLGSTDVICEGFASSSDPYVLKGSCGVEYRLMLTNAGEERYGHKFGKGEYGHEGQATSRAFVLIFWGLFILVLLYIILIALWKCAGGSRGIGPASITFPGGGGGGGDDDPPPPYEYHSSPNASKTYSTRTRTAPGVAYGGWRPGFWTGVLGGGAAGYMAGSRTQTRQQENTAVWGNNGEGSSRSGSGRTRSSGSSGTSSAPTFSSTRHESSGFGSTSRR